MTPVELSRTVLRAVRRAVDVGELSVSVPTSVAVTPPGPGGCGDYATNIALRLAGQAGRPALEVAEVLRPYITRDPGVAAVTVTGPGFLNVTLAGGASVGLVEEVMDQGARYGYGDTLAGQVVELRVPYETRAEVVAEALVRIVATQGGRAEVRHAEPVNLRPVPAPEDPAPLGHDAARWALLHPAPHDRPRISADHLLQRESNPLFRVRYAHARTRALRRNAATLGYSHSHSYSYSRSCVGVPRGVVRPSDGPGGPGDRARPADQAHTLHTDPPPPTPADQVHTSRTDPPPPHLAEADLLAALAEYPHALRLAARDRAPDRVARHLVVTADALLGFQYAVLPLGDEKPAAAHRARLALAEAAGAVLAGGLSLLGISAPDYL
ncbi:ArgS-related anticodon-binding protein NrtL [Streptomyces sp. NPDC005236]|uniref:ArgS-related anticodon-binding protein NrtL n=1 Tax=Streptomyces sp. NPDC005236 TaxID=3157028 RepID=UPI00339F52EB